MGALLMGVVPAQARDRDDRCAQRLRKAEAQLDNAISKHGGKARPKSAHKTLDELKG